MLEMATRMHAQSTCPADAMATAIDANGLPEQCVDLKTGAVVAPVPNRAPHGELRDLLGIWLVFAVWLLLFLWLWGPWRGEKDEEP